MEGRHLAGAAEPGASWDPEAPATASCVQLASWEAASRGNTPLPGLPGFLFPRQRLGVIALTQELKRGPTLDP